METETILVMKEAVRAAAEIIKADMEVGSIRSFEHKLHYDYVTETDKKSEQIIKKIIKSSFPDDVVIGEETFNGEELPEEAFWLIDPLDGTTNFIHTFPMISITVARVENGRPVAGCTYDPLADELFVAVKGEGLFLNDKKLDRPFTPPDVSHSLVATGFPFRKKDKTVKFYLAAFEEIFLSVSDIRRTGSAALDLAYLAVGRIDGFWEIGLKPWDIAAGILMIEEAGGLVSDFSGDPDSVMKSGNIIAASNKKLYDVIKNAIEKHLVPYMKA